MVWYDSHRGLRGRRDPMAELETVFFIHVPKTAGTSFRVALEQEFPDRLAFDYGDASPNTTDWVRRHVYEAPDRDRFRRELIERDIVAFGGHVGRPQYGDVFAPERTVAFVRAPIDRIISEWHHHRRHGQLTQPLEEFAKRPEMRNLQARLLQGAPIERYAVIGLTARYRESLQLVAQQLGWHLPELTLNRNPTQATIAPSYEVDPETAARLEELNENDLRHYRATEQLFETRAQALRREPSDPEIRGFIDGYKDGELYGWACRLGDPTPLLVRVLVDDHEVAVIPADRPRPDLHRKRIHPTGHAGFRLPLGELPGGTTIRCLTSPQAVELTGSPFLCGTLTTTPRN